MKLILPFAIIGLFLAGCSSDEQPPATPKTTETAQSPTATPQSEGEAAVGPHPMHKIAQEGDLEAAQEFIDNGGDVTVTAPDGNTFLHEAVNEGQLAMVHFLVEQGIDVNAESRQGSAIWTPLRLAIESGRHDIADFLIEKGANVNFKYPRGDGFLHEMSYSGDVKMVILLLEGGIDVNTRMNVGGFTPLYVAVQEGHLDIVLTIVETGKVDTSIEKNNPDMLIQVAEHFQREQMAEFLTDWKDSLQ